jgi:hypothetical protein
MKRLLIMLFAGLVLAGCATSGQDPLAPKTANSVNLKRYQGTWYELARLPMYFQRDCAQSEAHYTLAGWQRGGAEPLSDSAVAMGRGQGHGLSTGAGQDRQIVGRVRYLVFEADSGCGEGRVLGVVRQR